MKKFLLWSLKNWSISLAILVMVGLSLSVSFNPDLITDWFGENARKITIFSYIGAIGAGIFAVGNLYENTRRNNLSQKANMDIRFKDAATLLGSQDSSSILAGIFALHQIAEDSSKLKGNNDYVKTINDIFCATIREGNKDPFILKEILKRLNSGFYKEKNFINANLVNKDLSGAILIGANLTGANLIGSNLNEAKLIGANLTNSNLSRAVLKYADLTNADFTGANLTYAWLDSATFIKTIFIEANLTRARLRYSNLSNKDFTNVNLNKVSFYGSNLTNTNFNRVISLDGALFGSVRIDDNLRNIFCLLPFYGNLYISLERDAKRNMGSNDMNADVFAEMVRLYAPIWGLR